MAWAWTCKRPASSYSVSTAVGGVCGFTAWHAVKTLVNPRNLDGNSGWTFSAVGVSQLWGSQPRLLPPFDLAASLCSE